MTVSESSAEGDTTRFIYWNSVNGSRRVILRKVNGSYGLLPGAMLRIWRGDNTPIQGTDIHGNTDAVEFESGTSGVFYSGELNYGLSLAS